jgi:hypothetical protein
MDEFLQSLLVIANVSLARSTMRCVSTVRVVTAALGLLSFGAVAPARAVAQSNTLKVLGSDSVPIPYAWVSVQGAAARITDEHGLVNIGTVHHKTLTADVRRLGYQPWFGKLELPDTAVTVTIVLPRLTQELASVTVTAGRVQSALQLTGFYDRWIQKQKGALSATFIGPEEIERRHPARTTDLLSGINGISFTRTPDGGVVARGNGGTCFMTVLLDGHRLCPDKGCNNDTGGSTPNYIGRPPVATNAAEYAAQQAPPPTVNIDQYIAANDVVAIEVYARGGNMPISLQADDSACGVIAIWTGSRQP